MNKIDDLFTGVRGEVKIGVDDVKDFLEEYEIDKVQEQFTARLSTVLVAVLGLVTAIAWDDFLHDFIVRYIPLGDVMLQKLVYALIITLLTVLFSVYIHARIGKKAKQKVKMKTKMLQAPSEHKFEKE